MLCKKKRIISISLSFSLLCLSCISTPLNNSSLKSNLLTSSFGIKSTTNPNEIKKNFLPVTRITKLKKKDDEEKWKKYNFLLTSEDLKRKFSLNIVNGAGGGKRIGNLEVKINGKLV